MRHVLWPAILLVSTVGLGCRKGSDGPAPGEGVARTVTLSAPSSCTSAESPISLQLEDAAAQDVLNLLGAVAGVPVRSEVDLTGIVVDASVTDTPWDCLAEALADAVGGDVLHQPGQQLAIVARGG